MEKDYRLFVKNLPLNIIEPKIEELFGKYVTIKSIDLKEKKDLSDKINKFAFVNVTATDKSLHTCFGDLNGERIDGFQISVELAKESFLERLKRERSENKLKNEKPVPVKQEYSKSDFVNNIHLTSRPKHQTFSDVDFSSNDFQIEVSKKSSKYDEQIKEDSKDEDEKLHAKEISDHQKFEQKDSNKKFIKSKKQIFFDENGLESDKIKDEKSLKNKDLNKSNKDYNKLISSKISEKPAVITESEKKRLMSLKQKKQAFKAQEQTIRDALKFVDNRSNNKIIFDDNIDFQSSKSKNEKSLYKQNVLFDSEDEDQDKFKWNEDELDAKANLKKKLLKLQTNIGNDKRFILDERFVDDEEQHNENKQENQDDPNVLDEKKWQLDILGNVLGRSITAPMADNSDTIRKKNRMIRYDPSASNHQDYEVNVEKVKQEKPVKKRRKSSINEIQEEPAVPTSKEVFYDVSEKLVESLKQNEGFSLLKTFGRDVTDAGDSINKFNNETENKESFQFNFSAKNPFKYDSSDDEGGNEESNEKHTLTDSKTTETIVTRQKDDRLFFVHNDSRFREAEQFFKNQATHEEGAFKHRRRELKEIVRSKIRNNMKKSIPWNKRKVRKIQKK